MPLILYKVKRVVTVNKPFWFKRFEKSVSFKSREMYLEEYVVEQVDEVEEESFDVGYLSS